MSWRSDMLGVLAGELDNWTPKKWYRRLLKAWLLSMVIKEMQEEATNG